MKALQYISIAVAAICVMASCEKKETPAGVPEMEHHYYAVFFPNNNSAVTVPRSQTALLKFPVQLYSTFIRSYDAVARYAVTTTGITPPAVRGVDYDIVDKSGMVIPSADSSYNLVFPQAKQSVDTIYIKLLNNTATGARKFEVKILENKNDIFYVDIFSTAFRRPITIN